MIVNQDSSFITKQQLILLLNVLESRYVSKKYLKDFLLRQEVQSLFCEYSHPYAELWHHSPKKVRSAEKKFLSTFINLFILNEGITTQQKRKFVKQQLSENKKVATFIKTYLYVLEKNQFELISESGFIYDTVLFSGIMNHLIRENNEDVIRLLHLLLPTSYRKYLLALREKAINQEELQAVTENKSLLVLCVLLTLHYRKYRVPTITVGLSKELGKVCIEDLESFLRSFGFVTVLIGEKISATDCDLLLINYSLMKQKMSKEQRYYYWDQNNFPENYTALERKIFDFRYS